MMHAFKHSLMFYFSSSVFSIPPLLSCSPVILIRVIVPIWRLIKIRLLIIMLVLVLILALIRILVPVHICVAKKVFGQCRFKFARRSIRYRNSCQHLQQFLAGREIEFGLFLCFYNCKQSFKQVVVPCSDYLIRDFCNSFAPTEALQLCV